MKPVEKYFPCRRVRQTPQPEFLPLSPSLASTLHNDETVAPPPQVPTTIKVWTLSSVPCEAKSPALRNYAAELPAGMKVCYLWATPWGSHEPRLAAEHLRPEWRD